MKRRDFIAALGTAAVLPRTAPAQQFSMPVIGYFSSRSAASEEPIRKPFLKALEEFGFVAGSNIAIQYRFADGRDDRLPGLAADFIEQRAAMLVTTDRASSVAAKAATNTIPIVFASGVDPVQIGLVASFNRPGGNATGVSLLTAALGSKRLGVLRELLAQPGTIAFVVNPNSNTTPLQVREMEDASQSARQPLLIVEVGSEDEVDRAFAVMGQRKVAAVLYAASPLFQVLSERLVTLAARYPRFMNGANL